MRQGGHAVGREGGKGAPGAAQVSHAVYLGPDEQEKLSLRIVPLLKWNHFGRKNVGFLYAVRHGEAVASEIASREAQKLT